MGNAKKEDAGIKKGPSTARNALQKEKSRHAAQARRKNENVNIAELTRLVPSMPDNPSDKATIIRLSTSYIGLKQVLDGSCNGQLIGDGCSATKGIEKHGLEILDGFVIVLTKSGTITFVDDKVVHFLGFAPTEMMGKKIYNYVLSKDWEHVANKLRGPLPSPDNPNVKEPKDDPDGLICEPDASELCVPYFEDTRRNEKLQFSVRLLCNLARRANSSKTTNFQIVRFTGRINHDGYFIGTGEHAWSPDLGDLPVFEPAFISRLTPDLKLLFCEGRIHRYMDSEAKDIVGRNVYPFYHPTDIFHIQKMHSKLLAEGTVTTVPYRWMNRDGGWVWLKSTTTRIQDEKTGNTFMVCVNYVLSAIENKGVVVGVNPETNENVVERKNEKENEQDSDDAYLVNELTDAFTRSNPFGRPTYMPGPSSVDGQREIPNVFRNVPVDKPRYIPQEREIKRREGFYQQQAIREQSSECFETKWLKPDFAKTELQNNDCFLEDILLNEHFSLSHLPNNLFEECDEDLKRQCLEEPFRQEMLPPAITAQPDMNMEDSFDMPELMCVGNKDEVIAYNASMFLLTSPLPDSNLQEHVVPSTTNYHQRHSNGFTQNMLNGQDPEQCYQNISHINHNNNILPAEMVNFPQLFNGSSEETYISEFDTSLMN